MGNKQVRLEIVSCCRMLSVEQDVSVASESIDFVASVRFIRFNFAVFITTVFYCFKLSVLLISKAYPGSISLKERVKLSFKVTQLPRGPRL